MGRIMVVAHLHKIDMGYGPDQLAGGLVNPRNPADMTGIVPGDPLFLLPLVGEGKLPGPDLVRQDLAVVTGPDPERNC
jgi:hypothetical protein